MYTLFNVHTVVIISTAFALQLCGEQCARHRPTCVPRPLSTMTTYLLGKLLQVGEVVRAQLVDDAR